MDVIALVGPSGTGKSHRALLVAHQQHADAIIDDGLLIQDSKIVAGRSAKKEQSRIQAVKRAIFMDHEHTREVHDAIEAIKPERILILGTSDNMIAKITEALEIPPVSKIVRIEDIATPAEMRKAREIRQKEGKHIIPVPTIELQPHFSGYRIDPLDIFFKRSQHSNKRRKLGEKSIVRPAFSYYGKLLISDAAVASIVDQVARQDKNITATEAVTIKYAKSSEKGITISLQLTISYGCVLKKTAVDAQQRIMAAVEHMTGMVVNKVNIEIKRLSVAAWSFEK